MAEATTTVSITRTSTPLPTAIVAANCSVVTDGQFLTPSSTLGAVSVSWHHQQGIPTITYEAAHVTNLTGAVDNSCVNYWRCGGNLRFNNDVSGVGVVAAFLAAAWASFALLACAYWSGVLPPAQLRSADRIYFFGNSRRYHLAWRNTIERVALIISDQQLVTGLGMLIAGFYEAYTNDLDAYHFHSVVYLAWMSSNVHLTSLSLLQRRLAEAPLLRTIRLTGMVALLALLSAALVPSTSYAYSATINISTIYRPETPVRCFWGVAKSLQLSAIGTYWISWGSYPHGNSVALYASDRYAAININTVLSYLILYISYIWKVSQLFTGSRSWIRKWLRSLPESKMESAMKRCLLQRQRYQYRVIAYWYVVFVVWMETLESSLASMLLLFFALAWGTLQILLPRQTMNYYHPRVNQSEARLSFGQLLPLLLLLQPVLAIIEHSASINSSYGMQRIETLGLEQPKPSKKPGRPTETLADVLETSVILNADEKTSGLPDPVIGHLQHSRAFTAMIWTQIIAAFLTGAIIVGMGGALLGDTEFRIVFIGWVACGMVGIMPICHAIGIIFSRQLR